MDVLLFLRRPVSSWTRGAAAGGVALSLAALLTGCATDPVTIPPNDLNAADTRACEQLVAAFPDSVADQGRDKVSPAAALGGAWGNPPIVAECGAALPAGFDRTAACEEVNGVGWFVSEGADATTLVTAGYRPVLKVTVPSDYKPEERAATMVDLGRLVPPYLTLVKRCH